MQKINLCFVSLSRLLNTAVVIPCVICGVVLSGCGDREIKSGIFIDSPVEGIEWQTESRNGMTNVEGRFDYRGKERVSFSIGQVILGSAKGADYVTLTALLQEPSINSQSVVNMARLLQSLDEDFDPDDGIDNANNGIRILPSVRQAAITPLNFYQTIEGFELDSSVVSLLAAVQDTDNPQLIDREAAVAHLSRSIDSIPAKNEEFTVDAGLSSVVDPGSTVKLSGEVLGLDSGPVEQPKWVQVSDGGTQVDLDLSSFESEDANRRKFEASFIAPSEPTEQKLTFEFSASDNGTVKKDQLVITVRRN